MSRWITRFQAVSRSSLRQQILSVSPPIRIRSNSNISALFLSSNLSYMRYMQCWVLICWFWTVNLRFINACFWSGDWISIFLLISCFGNQVNRKMARKKIREYDSKRLLKEHLKRLCGIDLQICSAQVYTQNILCLSSQLYPMFC